MFYYAGKLLLLCTPGSRLLVLLRQLFSATVALIVVCELILLGHGHLFGVILFLFLWVASFQNWGNHTRGGHVFEGWGMCNGMESIEAGYGYDVISK